LKKADATAITLIAIDQSTQMARDHARSEAETIALQGLERFKLAESDLESLPGQRDQKVAIADSTHKSTTTPLGWAAQRLRMKAQLA
jgi:hypothetical protein